MGKLASFLMVSVDGYFEGSKPWALEWHNVDEEFNEFAIAQLEASDALIFGRVTYQGMAGYWPSREAVEGDPEVASRMNQAPKIVVSRSLDKPDPAWANARLLKANVMEELRRLKQTADRDLLVLGSSNLTASLMDAGVLDELRLIVNPVALGAGHPVLEGARNVPLKLLSARPFRSGNVLLTYAPRTGIEPKS
ncbi:MAG TPA: dihydrofolate reductase family protein [Candidatus Dormibacteraeota bacterium]